MNQRSLELALKKQRLRLQCAAQRDALSIYVTGLAPAFSAADAGANALRWLARSPLVLTAAGAALFIMKPRRVLRWGMRGLSLWRIVRRVGRL